MSACNLATGSLSISRAAGTCGSASVDLTSPIRVTGTSTSSQIVVENVPGPITIILDGVSLTRTAPVRISNSNVNIVLAGSSSIVLPRLDGLSSGIRCQSSSNITFSANGAGSLAIDAYEVSGSGIGPFANDVCGTLRFSSGSYSIRSGISGAAIGGYGGAAGEQSSVEAIVIESGDYSLTSRLYGAAIGAGGNSGASSVSSISISGGTIRVIGGPDSGDSSIDGAGIGSGGSTSPGTSSVSKITISGGTITSSGYTHGAVIGAGTARSSTSSVGSITISGGSISIPSTGAHGTGIGSGLATLGTSSVGTISISAGTIDVKATGQGAGIGSGQSGFKSALASIGSTSKVEGITITGGTVTASATAGAAIGAGFGLVGRSVVGSISVINAAVTVRAGAHGAGIGAGYAYERGESSVDLVLLDHATVDGSAATGAVVGSGQGLYAYGGAASTTVKNITIVESTITAAGGDGAAIGSGAGAGASSTVGSISIEGGTFTLTSSNGATIGSGRVTGVTDVIDPKGKLVHTGLSTVGSVVIASGLFVLTAANGAAVGAGAALAGDSKVGSISIVGGSYRLEAPKAASIGAGSSENGAAGVNTIAIDGIDLVSRAGVALGSSVSDVVPALSLVGNIKLDATVTQPYALSAATVTAGKAAIVASTNTAVLVGPGITTGDPDWIVGYGVPSQFERFGTGSSLHFGQIPPLNTSNVTFTVKNKRSFGFSVAPVGLKVTLPVGTYEVGVSGGGRDLGYLCIDGVTTFAVNANDTFYGSVGLCEGSNPAPPGASGGSLGTGAVVGLIIGVVFIVVALAVVVFMCLRHGSRDQNGVYLQSGLTGETAYTS